MNQTLKDFRERLVKLQRRDLDIESNEYKEQLSLENLLLKFDDVNPIPAGGRGQFAPPCSFFT